MACAPAWERILCTKHKALWERRHASCASPLLADIDDEVTARADGKDEAEHLDVEAVHARPDPQQLEISAREVVAQAAVDVDGKKRQDRGHRDLKAGAQQGTRHVRSAERLH